jgi:type IV pilus assembly protein PilM
MKLFAQKRHVGVDLGSHRIKVAQVESDAGGSRTVRTGSYPTPPNAIRDGLVLEVAAVAEALNEALKQARITATNGIVAAAGGSVFVRPVPFPKLSEAVLRRSIRLEASRFIPGSPTDSFIECEILNDLEDGKMNVLVVAASKEVVESRIAVCEAVGLTVEVVDIEAFAMYRALLEVDPMFSADEDTIALIDIGSAMTNLSVIHGGQFVVNRSVPHGGRILTDALKSYFKLDDADAEDGKSQLDARELLKIPAVKENPPLLIVQPHIDDLVREVRRSLNYFQSQQVEGNTAPQRVTRIVLAGGGSKLVGLAEYMEEKLGVSIECAGIYAGNRFKALSEGADSGLDMAVAAGLAIHGTIRRAA